MIAYFDEESEKIAFQLAADLRINGLKVDLNLGIMKFNKVFKTAESRNHQCLALIGETERNSGVVQLKNLKNKESENINLTDIEKIKKYIQGIN